MRDRLAEQVLVLRCQTGDEQAFEQLVSEYSSRLRYYLLKLTGRRDAADDLLQDVWLDVYRRISRLRDPAAFRTWVYRIARDRAFRLLRRTRQQYRLLEDDALAASDHDPVFTEEDAERVHHAIESLSPEHREVLLLRFIEDLPYAEIASISGCTLGTVKSRLHYAKQMLRQTIDKESDDD